MQKILIIILSISLLSSCGMMNSPSPENKMWAMSAGTQMATGAISYEAAIASTSTKIRASEEFQGCMKQNANMCIQSAGNQLAQKSKDPSFCKELSDANQQSSCEFAVTMISATEKNDIKLCDTLTNAVFKTQCQSQLYRQDAVAKKDIKLCDKLEIPQTPTASGAPIAVDTNMMKDQCIMQVIISDTESTEKDCSTITNTGSFEMCKVMVKNKPLAIPPTPPVGITNPITTGLPPVSPAK